MQSVWHRLIAALLRIEVSRHERSQARLSRTVRWVRWNCSTTVNVVACSAGTPAQLTNQSLHVRPTCRLTPNFCCESWCVARAACCLQTCLTYRQTNPFADRCSHRIYGYRLCAPTGVTSCRRSGRGTETGTGFLVVHRAACVWRSAGSVRARSILVMALPLFGMMPQ